MVHNPSRKGTAKKYLIMRFQLVFIDRTDPRLKSDVKLTQAVTSEKVRIHNLPQNKPMLWQIQKAPNGFAIVVPVLNEKAVLANFESCYRNLHESYEIVDKSRRSTKSYWKFEWMEECEEAFQGLKKVTRTTSYSIKTSGRRRVGDLLGSDGICIGSMTGLEASPSFKVVAFFDTFSDPILVRIHGFKLFVQEVFVDTLAVDPENWLNKKLSLRL
uniref:Uncharacterized protein n=1 Tax=Cannabis sativa TaxID=3483 RepID=A0A803PQ03_CANSA